MHRRTLLAAALLSLTPSLALADVAPSPPPPLAVEGVSRVFTGRTGGPSEAEVVLHNTGSAPLEARIERVVVLTPGMRLPLRITGASPARTITVAPGQRVPVRVSFAPVEGPAARTHEWTFEVGIAVDVPGGMFGRYVTGTTTVRRIPLPG